MPKLRIDIGVVTTKARAGVKRLKKMFRGLKGFMGGFGGLLPALGIGAMVVGLKNAAQAAGSFQKQMAEVNTIARLSRTDLSAIGKEVKNLATELGVTTDELTGGLYQALSAGIPADNAIEFLRIATQAAIGGVTDVTTAVDGMTTVMNAYGMSTSQASKVSDNLFQIVKDGKINFSELAQNISKLAPMAKAAGLSFDEMSAAIATAVKVEKPERAMTAIRAALVEVTKKGKTLIDTVKEFRGASLRTIFDAGFSQESANGIALLANNAALLDTELENMTNSGGAAAAAFQELADTDFQKLAQFNANMKEIQISIGEGILPLIAEWAEGMNALISSGNFLKTTFIGLFRNIEQALPEFLSGTATFKKLFGEDLVDLTFGELSKGDAITPEQEEAEAKRIAQRRAGRMKGSGKDATMASLRVEDAMEKKSGAGLALTNLQNVGGNLGSVSRVNKGEMLLKTQVDLQKTLVSQVTLLNNKMKTGSQSNRLAR